MTLIIRITVSSTVLSPLLLHLLFAIASSHAHGFINCATEVQRHEVEEATELGDCQLG